MSYLAEMGTRDHSSVKHDLVKSGVATIRNAVASESIASAADWLSAVISLQRSIPATFEAEFEHGTDAARKLRRLYWNDPTFWRTFLTESGLSTIAASLVGARVTLTFQAAFLKTSQVGTAVPLHQDQALWQYTYPNAVSIWVALTSATRHNGCLVGCPGSHQRGLVPHRQTSGHSWHAGINWQNEGLAAPVPYELKPGDALAWHRYFVHGSGANHSLSPRWGVVFVFVDQTQPNLRTTDRADF
jgi:ectoine hydroxylase-related dioxygenase (phytanoyl-CoA dioxygenase family)